MLGPAEPVWDRKVCHIASVVLAETLMQATAGVAQTLFDMAQQIVDILKAQHIVDKRWEPYDATEGGGVEWMVMKWRDCWQWSGIGGEKRSEQSVSR
jgi:hypothetical protein